MKPLRSAIVVGVLALPAVSAAQEPATGPNLIANPGFELAVPGVTSCTSVPVSTGNWTSQAGIGQIAAIVTNPIHSGAQSARVRTIAQPGCGSAFFYQDVPQLAWTESFTLSAWMHPVEGLQQMSVLFGWDHQSTVAGSADIAVSPEGVGFQAWGIGGNAPPVTYNAWHHFRLVLNTGTLTQQLFVDGVLAGSAAMGTPAVGTGATLLLGQGTGVGTPASEAFFDDVVVARPAAVCDIQMSNTTYVNGDVVTANVFRFANPNSTPVAAEIKVWLGLVGGTNISLINAGANGTVLFPAGLDQNVGPVPLFMVAPGVPRGEYELSCRILDPITGKTLASDFNPFVIQ